MVEVYDSPVEMAHRLLDQYKSIQTCLDVTSMMQNRIQSTIEMTTEEKSDQLVKWQLVADAIKGE